MPESSKRKTSNGFAKDAKKSKQDVSSDEELSEEMPLELPGPSSQPAPSSQPGPSCSNVCDYIQIIVTGPKECGRSSLVCSYMDQLFPPKGSNFLSKQYLKLRPSKKPVMIWDLDARDEFSAYRQKSYQEADVALLCYDIKKPDHQIEREDRESLKKLLTKWREELVNQYDNEIKIILVGLKEDLRNNSKFDDRHFYRVNEINVALDAFREIQGQRFEVSAHRKKDKVVKLFEHAIAIAEQQPKLKRMFAYGGFEIVNPHMRV